MYTVYIIKNNKNSIYYKGYTTNLKTRIKDHNNGKVKSTAKYKPWKLIFYCTFSSKKKALEFEKYLKSSSGIAFMRKRLV